MSDYLPPLQTGEPKTTYAVWSKGPLSWTLHYTGPSLAIAQRSAVDARKHNHCVDIEKTVTTVETVERMAESEDFIRGFWAPTFKKLGWAS